MIIFIDGKKTFQEYESEIMQQKNKILFEDNIFLMKKMSVIESYHWSDKFKTYIAEGKNIDIL